MKQLSAEVISNQQVLPGLERLHGRCLCGAWVIRLNAPDIARQARPGQFIMVRCEGCTLPRPFSIHRVDDNTVSILYTVWEKGLGTDWLAHRQSGEKVEIFGPLGNGFNIDANSRNLLLLAGGIGIAPLCYLASEALKSGKAVRLLAGAATAEQLCPTEIMPGGTDILYATEDLTLGETRLVTDLLPDNTGWADQVFACGPMAMYRDMTSRARELGLEGKPAQVSLEMRMGCGVGVCYSCTIRTRRGLKQVCKDGPVFEMDEIVWDGLTSL